MANQTPNKLGQVSSPISKKEITSAKRSNTEAAKEVIPSGVAPLGEWRARITDTTPFPPPSVPEAPTDQGELRIVGLGTPVYVKVN